MNAVLKVCEIFPSVNGEGDEMGRRTMFVRCWGCSARCPGCDTAYSVGDLYAISKGYKPAPEETFDIQAPDFSLDMKKKKVSHITITGGEPFEQPDLLEFVTYLIHQGFQVTIETNGMRRPMDLPMPVHYVVSPKPWMLIDKNRDSYQYWARMGATFKFVGSIKDIDRIRKWHRVFRLQTSYLQPWIETAEQKTIEGYVQLYKDILKELNEKCVDGEDIRLVMQLHKIIWGFDTRGV